MKILIQYSNCKFINNLDSMSDKHELISVNIENNIYQIQQKINPDIYILIASKIGNEEAHFCHNNPNEKIIIYNDTEQNITLPNAKTINSSTLPVLFNPNRFNNTHIDKDIEYSYFLDKDTTLPKKLTQHLLPNKVNTIKMFNNPKIDHSQKLGLLSENDKSDILNRTQNYICDNLFYAIEAHLCGCKVLDMDLQTIDIKPDNYQTYSMFFESLI